MRQDQNLKTLQVLVYRHLNTKEFYRLEQDFRILRWRNL